MPHTQPPQRQLGRKPTLFLVLCLGLISACDILTDDGGLAITQAPTDLGPNVTVFDPAMPVAEIQADMDAVYAQQVNAEMGSGRYAFLFKPGVYGTDTEPLQVKMGYYTEVAGLGASPAGVTINGKIEVYNRCSRRPDGTEGCVATTNFWRTLSNLTLKVNGLGQSGCRRAANFYAVSQAASIRRLDVQGGTLSLMDYCTAGPRFASGGFLADSRTGAVNNGSQQQWLTRNSQIGSWSNAVWNQVFAGVEGAPSDANFPRPPYTTLETTPVSREKPYLFVDDAGAYQVRIPAARTDTRGISWAAGETAGRTTPLSAFFVAKPSDSVQVMNNALARGLNLLLTPGRYDIDQTIKVKRPDTVVLGLGHATLTAVGGAVPMTVADVPGVIVAGVTFDGGLVNSPVLLQVGTKNGNNGTNKSDPNNPTTLSDVYFRIGGPYVGKADVSLEINSDHVLLDHLWVWRADHGVPGSFGWEVSTGRNGVVVNGDDVTATGLFVEHYQEYNVIWNGERGKTVMFQNELPYDPPNQAAWTQPDGTLGWAAYKVADGVKEHRLWGGGSYIFTNVDPTIRAARGFEVPVTSGVRLEHIMTVNLSAGTIDRVVNDTGAPVSNSNAGRPSFVVQYP